jgi:tetratricopeptide (TPR) repeat protein
MKGAMRLHAVLFLILALAASGQTNPHKAEFQRLQKLGKPLDAYAYLKKAYPQWDLRKLLGLSMLIDSVEKDPQPQGRFVWKYQRKILEAARVNLDTETEEEIGRKVAAMWKVCDELDVTICNNTKFDVSNGNVIKFAVNLKFDEFLIDMVHWNVGFNKVDEMDGRTVLDYIADKIKSNDGLASEPVLRRYYDMVRQAGGRHKSELHLSIDELHAPELAKLAGALRVDPQNFETYLARAKLYDRMGRFDEGIADCGRAAELAKGNISRLETALTIRAGLYRRARQFDRAVADYEQTIVLIQSVPGSPELKQPVVAEVHHQIGHARREEGRLDLAIAAFTQALEGADPVAPLLIDRAKAYAAQGRADLAQADEAKVRALGGKLRDH